MGLNTHKSKSLFLLTILSIFLVGWGCRDGGGEYFKNTFFIKINTFDLLLFFCNT